MNYDFDRIIDRSGSGDVKHCKLEEYFHRTDLLPLWVADMDFATPPFVLEALQRRLQHPILGYTTIPDALWSAIQRWLLLRHGWHVQTEWLSFIPGVVKGLGLAVNVFVPQGERVIIQPPVYHPFRLVPQGNNREVVMNPLLPRMDHQGRLVGYDMNLDELERLARDPDNRLLILSNPHNPAGIVWDRETLLQVAEICSANDVVVISDEIHSDMSLFGHRHIPFASVSDDAAQCSITFGAPSKTFNIAGLASSFAVIPNTELRRRFRQWIDASELAEPTLFAPIATIAAFSDEGELWRRQHITYLEDNIRYVENYCSQYLPSIRPLRPHASFLVWLDCRLLKLDHSGLLDLFINRAHLALNDGVTYGSEGSGFMRLNVGCPRALLQQALQQLRQAVASHPNL